MSSCSLALQSLGLNRLEVLETILDSRDRAVSQTTSRVLQDATAHAYGETLIYLMFRLTTFTVLIQRCALLFFRNGLSTDSGKLDYAELLEDVEVEQASREERAYRNWINSLGIETFVHSLFEDVRDGYVKNTELCEIVLLLSMGSLDQFKLSCYLWLFYVFVLLLS